MIFRLIKIQLLYYSWAPLLCGLSYFHPWVSQVLSLAWIKISSSSFGIMRLGRWRSLCDLDCKNSWIYQHHSKMKLPYLFLYFCFVVRNRRVFINNLSWFCIFRKIEIINSQLLFKRLLILIFILFSDNILCIVS